LVAIATVMVPIALTTVFPPESWIATPKVVGAPTKVVLGRVVKPSLLAEPTVMSKAMLVALARPGAVAVSA
jgi:hypothetical protein